MTTCTWNFRRHARRVFAAACVVALASELVVPRASADQISDLRSQAAALASRIQTLGIQEASLSEQYDADQLAVQSLEAKVAEAAKQLTAAANHASRARAVLETDAIQAYVHGGNNPLTTGSNPMNDATNSLLRAEYVDSLATDQSDAIDQYHLAAVEAQSAKANLQQQTTAAQAEVQQVDQARQAVSSSQVQLQAALNQDKGRIAVLVAQQEAAAAAAAAAAARARQAAALAAQQAAARQAAARQAALVAEQQAATRQSESQSQRSSDVTSSTAAAAVLADSTGSGASAPATTSAPAPSAPAPSAPVSAPPPVGSGAMGAVAAAESRVGDPYVWGAAGPSAFDCSGLVMWAYEQVGISLPHYSGAQYADTTHIPISDVEPGDLVFPSDPGQHVAMYVGNGDIVEAPYTGATVHIIPMSSWFVLASRVE